MKKLKPLFLFIFVYTAMVGCSKKNDPVAPACSLDSYMYVNGTNTSTTTYTYANNKVVKVSVSYGSGTESNVVTTNYSYDSQGKVTTSIVSGDSGSPSYTTTYSYDTQGNLTQVTSPAAKTVFKYNSSNQMVKREIYDANNSTFTLDSYSIFTYPSTDTKNYSKALDYDSSNKLLLTSSFIYDAKHSPKVSPGFPEPTSNVTYGSYEYPGNGPIVLTYIYTYNDNGFPLTVTETYGSHAYTITYTYTNCK